MLQFVFRREHIGKSGLVPDCRLRIPRSRSMRDLSGPRSRRQSDAAGCSSFCVTATVCQPFLALRGISQGGCVRLAPWRDCCWAKATHAARMVEGRSKRLRREAAICNVCRSWEWLFQPLICGSTTFRVRVVRSMGYSPNRARQPYRKRVSETIPPTAIEFFSIQTGHGFSIVDRRGNPGVAPVWTINDYFGGKSCGSGTNGSALGRRLAAFRRAFLPLFDGGRRRCLLHVTPLRVELHDSVSSSQKRILRRNRTFRSSSVTRS